MSDTDARTPLRTLLVIGPRDNVPAQERVAAALQRKRQDLRVVTSTSIAQGCETRAQWRSAYASALAKAAFVVVVPRPDLSIGKGTLQDLGAAGKTRTKIFVVSPSGQMVPLRAARYEKLPRPPKSCRDPEVIAAGFKTAARFTFEGSAP